MIWIERLVDGLDFLENGMRNAAPKRFIRNEIAKERRMFADFARIGLLQAFFVEGNFRQLVRKADVETKLDAATLRLVQRIQAFLHNSVVIMADERDAVLRIRVHFLKNVFAA